MTDATEARDEAMARADAAADEAWKEAHLICLRILCDELGSGGRLTTDDIHIVMNECAPGVSTHEPRAEGPLMARYAKFGLIRKTDEYRQSEEESCHARPKRVWEVV